MNTIDQSLQMVAELVPQSGHIGQAEVYRFEQREARQGSDASIRRQRGMERYSRRSRGGVSSCGRRTTRRVLRLRRVDRPIFEKPFCMSASLSTSDKTRDRRRSLRSAPAIVHRFVVGIITRPMLPKSKCASIGSVPRSEGSADASKLRLTRHDTTYPLAWAAALSLSASIRVVGASDMQWYHDCCLLPNRRNWTLLKTPRRALPNEASLMWLDEIPYCSQALT